MSQLPLSPAAQAKGREIARAMAFYMMPFAVILVAMGAAASGFHAATIGAIVVVIGTTAANFGLLEYLRRNPAQLQFVRAARLSLNYFFNILIVYLLWPYWRPIWILLLPSIAAVALAEDRETTMGTAGLFTIVLLYVAWSSGRTGRAELCETAMYAATVWTMGLVVNRLTRVYAR